MVSEGPPASIVAKRISLAPAVCLQPGGTAGVLGLAYKPDTDVVEESQGLALAQALLAKGVRVVAYDPAAIENARSQLKDRIAFAGSAAECAGQADVLAITTAWPEFRKLRPSDLKYGSRVTVVDCWRLLPRSDFEAIAEYAAPGLAVESALYCAT